MTVSNFKELWVSIQDNGKILTCWCTCMAGARQCWNHVITFLFEIGKYAWINWSLLHFYCLHLNKSTQKEIEPKCISGIVMRKYIRSKHQSTDDQDVEVREQARLRTLQAFDPRQEPHDTKTNQKVFSLNSLLEVCPEAVLF